MLYSWSNRRARRLRSQGPVGPLNNSAMEKFINLPLELHLEIVSHLSPDDLIKLIRILNAYDPSNSLCSAVHIIERPSDLERGSCKPIKVIFITNLFSSIFEYYQLVERCQKSLNFVLMRGDTQDSPLLKWLPMFLTDETIGHRTKVHVSGRIQKLRFVSLVITGCGLYSESLTRIKFVRCGGKGLGEFKLGGKLMRRTCVRWFSNLEILRCSQQFVDSLNMNELWTIRNLILSCPDAEMSVKGMRLNFQGTAEFFIFLKSLRNCVFLGDRLIVRNVDPSTDSSCNPGCTEIRDLKAPYMRSMDVGFHENFLPVNIQAGRLDYVFLDNVSRRHPQTVREQDDYSFLNNVKYLKLHGLYDPLILSRCKFSRMLGRLRLGVPRSQNRNGTYRPLPEHTKHIEEVLFSSGLARRKRRNPSSFIKYFWENRLY